MPYIDPKKRRAQIDPAITKIGKRLLDWTDGNKRAGKYFFFRFLIVLFETLQTRIKTGNSEMHYKDWRDLDGEFGCAWKELWRRWQELIPLRLKTFNWEMTDRMAKRYVKEPDEKEMRVLVQHIVEHYDQTTDGWVGEANYTISEVANLMANSERATHQELLDMAFAASNELYFTHTGKHEDKVIMKNGDTAGFKMFHEKFAQKRRRR